MSIKKETSSTLRIKGVFSTSICNDIAKSIKNPDALAIWVYLQTQNEAYKIRRTHLQDHFGLGETRYQKAMTLLKEMRLIRRIQIKDEQGRILDNELECWGVPYDIDIEYKIAEHPENPVFGKINNLDELSTGITEHPVFPVFGKPRTSGKQGTNNISIYSNNISIKTIAKRPVDNSVKNQSPKRADPEFISHSYIEEHARPGESYEQAKYRLSRKMDKNYQEYA